MTRASLLRKAWQASGLTLERFAADILGRSRFTVSRWLHGHRDIPAPVVTRLKTYLTSTQEW